MKFRFLFKRKRVSSGQRLLVAMSRLQLAKKIGHALRDPKLNCVQLPGLGEKRRKPLSFKRQVALKLSAAFSFCVARHEIEQSSISPVCTRAFVREKLPQETVISYNPEKPPGGRFFCCRSIIPVSKRQRSASLAVRRGNSEAYSRHAPPKGTAKRLPATHHLRETAQRLSRPSFYIHIKKRGKISLAFLRTVARPNATFPQKRGIDESLCFP